jgi:N-acyl-D-amino-acid deacylase
MHMTIRRILAAAYVCLVLVFVFGRSRILLTNTARAVQETTPPKAMETAVDLLLRGGTVVDGTGSAPRQADVGIRGDRIAFIGNAKEAKLHAVRVLDARSLVIAPGFIDPHTHADADLSSATRNSNVNYLMQGVTTVIVGNDGLGTPRVTEMLEKWEQQGIGTNTGVLVGHGVVRREVLGLGDVQPTGEQLDQMRALVHGAMEQGAFGLSTGLYYVPGSFAKTEEVIELAKVAAAAGGIYDTHMRDEGSYSIGLLGSIEETIRIGREADIPVHISHIKALGPDVWGYSVPAIERIRKARAEGVDVTASQYPYTASSTNLVPALLPPWAQADKPEDVLARLIDSAPRRRLLEEMTENLKRRGGPQSLLFTSAASPELLGKTLEDIARQRNVPPVEVALDLITAAARSANFNGLSVASFNMNEEDIARFMKQDWTMTDSDGFAGHPRLFGTFPRKLRMYVYQKKLITLPFAIRASSGLTAATFHINERGLLKSGFFADVIAFDPSTIADRATYEKPELLSTGMKYVIVNGRLAVDNGQYTGILAGHTLRRQQDFTKKSHLRPKGRY